jgi:hypothetical protein
MAPFATKLRLHPHCPDSRSPADARACAAKCLQLTKAVRKQFLKREAFERATDTIAHVATGQNGLTSTSTRTIIIQEAADNLRFHHAKSSQTKLRTYASFTYQAGSWTRPRKVAARLECSLRPDAGDSTRTSTASAGRWKT